MSTCVCIWPLETLYDVAALEMGYINKMNLLAFFEEFGQKNYTKKNLSLKSMKNNHSFEKILHSLHVILFLGGKQHNTSQGV